MVRWREGGRGGRERKKYNIVKERGGWGERTEGRGGSGEKGRGITSSR